MDMFNLKITESGKEPFEYMYLEKKRSEPFS